MIPNCEDAIPDRNAAIPDRKEMQGKKVLVVGDIALDRTFFCHPAPPGRHASHAGESILDVDPGGDDHGTLGSAANACLLFHALGMRTHLCTATGDDTEADRVAEIAGTSGISLSQLRLPSVQTVTRFRFFIPGVVPGSPILSLRVDKDPDVDASYREAEAQVCTDAYMGWFENEVRGCEAVHLIDTDKGFLSGRVLRALDQRIRKVKQERLLHGRRQLTVVVDPKRSWDKYAGLALDVFKPNLTEALRVVGPMSFRGVEDLPLLGERLLPYCGLLAPALVITLGEHGAALLTSSASGAQLLHCAPFVAPEGEGGIAMHVGDMFGAALTAARVAGAGLLAAIEFANYVAAVQFSLPVGRKISSDDLADGERVAGWKRLVREPLLLASWPPRRQ